MKKRQGRRVERKEMAEKREFDESEGIPPHKLKILMAGNMY